MPQQQQQQQQQQQGREGCGRLPTWQTASRTAGRKLGPLSAHSLGETKPKGLNEQARQLGRGTSCPAWALGPHWSQTHRVTLGHLLLLSLALFPLSASEQSGAGHFFQPPKLLSIQSKELIRRRRGFTLLPRASPFPFQRLSLSVQK